MKKNICGYFMFGWCRYDKKPCVKVPLKECESIRELNEVATKCGKT
ncbi:MAG: hypothetical protein WCS62_02400 [Bacilli bacterium]